MRKAILKKLELIEADFLKYEKMRATMREAKFQRWHWIEYVEIRANRELLRGLLKEEEK